ncbi:uncharacterized protein V6R79_011222 [Siganus canaliculatus]
MQSKLGSEKQKSAQCALWPVDLKLTHLDWNSDATLIHFQGQYLSICELDYNILQGEIQNIPKTKAAVDVGEFCLVEDLTSGRWYRGRVQNRKEELFDVFLIDHGNVLTVDISKISSCSNDLFILPPKIVCGFLANVLLLDGFCNSAVEKYFSILIGKNVTGYIQALLPHKVLLLETPEINNDLVCQGFGRHVDTDTFLLLVEILTEVPLRQNTEPVPDLLIEKPRGQELCFKSCGFQGYEDILSFCGPKLTCGTRAKVRVTAAVSPRLFYCQMVSMETELYNMSKKLAAVCESRTKTSNQTTPENLGLLCSVKGKDGRWHRGLVQILPVNSQVRVLFIDYGFCEFVRTENIRRLPPELDSTPIMAFPCSLFLPGDQEEEAQQMGFLKAGLLGRMLNVTIRDFDEQQHLYSISVTGVKDNCQLREQTLTQDRKIKAEVEEDEESPQGGYLYHEIVMCEELEKTMEAEKVQVDSVFVGYVEHVQNPNHFWIRTQKRNYDFEEMMTKMMEHFSQVKLDEDVLSNPELGMLCCAVYEKDLHFYRGVVTDTLQHGAEVFYIDFGNTEKVPHMLIKKMPKPFANIPAFAFCCSLANVLPLDEVWTSATIEFFRKAVSDKALFVHVLQRKKNKFVVDLCEMGSDSNRSITELMISSEQAEHWNNIPIERVVRNTTDRNNNIWSEVTSSIHGNEKRLKDHVGEEEKTFTTEMEEAQVPLCFKPLSIKPGFEIAVCCSSISSPSDFWCQPQDTVLALKELMDKMQQFYSTHRIPLQSEDLCCVAKSPEDGRWHRAFITERQKGLVRVLLVDYGHTIQLQESNLQAVRPVYISLEEQAFRCSLYNLVEPADPSSSGIWSPRVCNLLNTFVQGSTSGLTCEVISQVNVKNKGLCNVVDLYNPKDQKTITSILVEQGLAREVTVSTNQLATVCPESYVFSSHDLSPGNEEQVHITHVSSQWEVYFHLERNANIIDELEEKISEESAKMMQVSKQAVVKNLCLAKYLDGRWYRGIAHSVQSPLHLSVFFVDYGNTNISEKTQVMFIPRDSADLLYTPMQAVRCSLASVPKEEHFSSVKEWLNEAILNKQVTALIRARNKDGSFNVELIDGQVNINEKVKELIINLTPKPEKVVSSTTKSTERKPITLYCIPQKRNSVIPGKHRSPYVGLRSYPTLTNAVRAAPPGSRKNTNVKSNVCGKALSKNVRIQQKSCTRSSRPVPAHLQRNTQVKPQKDKCGENTTSKQSQCEEKTELPQVSSLPSIKVTKGFRANCFVSHVNSVHSFYLQLSEDEPAILKLGEDLNSTIVTDSLKTATSLKIDDLVLAEYEEDGALYRSVVKDYEGNSCFKVDFVDYGNSAVVGQEKIYSIPKEFLSQSRFGIPCSLSDTTTYKNDSSFTDAVMEKPLMVRFLCQHGDHWEVEIFDDTTSFPEPYEAAAEISIETETENQFSDLSDVEEMVKSCEENYPRKEGCEKETSESDRMMPIVESVQPKVQKPAATHSLKKMKPVISRLHRRRQKGNGKTMKLSVKPESGGVHAVIPVRAKDTEHCTVLSVLSNGNFYVRLNRTSDLLSALESCITDNSYKYDVVAEVDAKEGLRCLVQIREDKKWHRAIVQRVCEGKCQILLVDHGTVEEIPSCSLRRQSKDLTKIPHCAILCKINCFGFTEDKGSHMWCETLKAMIGKEVKVMFVCYSEAAKLWKVEIFMNGLFLVRPVMTSLQQNQELLPTPANSQNEAAEGKNSMDTGQPQQFQFASVDMDKAYSAFAAAVTTPFEFCIVLEDLLVAMSKVSIMLDDLCGEMPPLPEHHRIPGTCCLLKSDTKNKWCRAEIIQSDTTIVLNLVDYGHYECLPSEKFSLLKRLPAAVADLPKVTYPCTLRGVKPVRSDGQWTDEAAVFFQQCLYQKSLQIFFREFVSNAHWKVDVLADDVHVAKELVDAGHASYVDVMLGLRFQEQSMYKAAPRGPKSEDECDQGDRRSEHSTDEADDKMPLSSVSETKQCFLM